ARDAEERAQESECSGGGGRQRAPDVRAGPGRGQGAEVACALAADQPDRQSEDREREHGTGGRGDVLGRRQGSTLALDLDREPGLRRGVARVSNLLVRQRPARLDEPARGDLLPAVAT